jgi:tetratricopeptide (TPR) repeat protein
MQRPLFIIFILLFVIGSGLSQTSEKYSGDYSDFFRAEELFEKEQYSAARQVFREFINRFNQPNDPLYIKARYYEGVSALELYNNDAIPLLMEFNHDYPENIYKHEIFFRVGQYHFQNKKFGDARDWFIKADPRQIDTSYTAEYYFKLGYSHFQLGEYPQARNAFHEVKDTQSSYASPALYYYSHIAYMNKSYQVALDGFLKLLNVDAFKTEVPYYITQIYYLMGQYDEVIAFAPMAIDTIKGSESPEMLQLIGDAYYRIGKFDEAVVYLESYNQKSKTTREDDYQLGYAYYKTGMYGQAIRMFDRVSRTKDKLGQVAFYHIAECYVNMNELTRARLAFKAAADLDFDIIVQEDALYNFAVMSYKVDYNPYNEALKAFEIFLEKFPNSKRRNDVYEYLVNMYSSTKKYQEALNSLDKLPSLDIKLKTAYQIIAFNKGVEEFERGKFRESIATFKLVDKHPIDQRVSGKAIYWQAEAHYMLEEYNDAVRLYRQFLTIPGNYSSNLQELAYYNIAYAYFVREDYTQAVQEFRTFTQLPNVEDKARLADAYARIGDSYFANKENPNFDLAVLNYKKAVELNQNNQDQALFYLAIAYGFIPGKSSDKITSLQNIINNHKNSKYMIRSIYEIGLMYKFDNNLDKSLQYFEQIVRDYPKNIKVKEALIEIGDIKFKQRKYTESESFFKRVLNEYTLDDETCRRATNGLRDIYRATLQTERINEIRTKYPCANISDDDQETFFYESANQLYVTQKYNEAIVEINKYLSLYPNGRFAIQLKSALADIYYTRDEKGQALTLYEQIIAAPVSSFTEEALIRASKTLYNEGQYNRALPHYIRLESLASSPQVIYNTRIGIMRCNYLIEEFADAAAAAKKVLNDQLINNDIRVEANYVAGMSLFKTAKYSEAIPHLDWTQKNTGAVRGTEALHYLAYSHYHLRNYSEVDKLHTQLLNRKPDYDYWIAQSFMLKSRSLMMRDDLFAAEQNIRLVINNYPVQDDGVLADANKILSEILQLKDQPKNIPDNSGRTIDMEEGGNND